MSTITKEWLQQKIADMEAARDEIPFGMDEDDSKTLAALRIALASLEAEPVAEVCEGFALRYIGHGPAPKSGVRIGDRLYTTAPAPVSVPDEVSWEDVPEEITEDDMALASAWAHGFNQCRAAMLQGAEPVKTAYKLPGDFESFISWLTSGDGIPDWLINGDKLDDEKVSFLLKVYRAGGNSPVIPDGWVLVPVEPSEDMIIHGFESEPDESFSDADVWEAYEAMSGCQQAAHRAKLCWAAMIAAAPKTEHK